jgi:hypothetical protein
MGRNASKRHISAKLFTCVVALFEEAQRLSDDFARRLIETALDLLIHESFELWCERNVHVDQPSR